MNGLTIRLLIMRITIRVNNGYTNNNKDHAGCLRRIPANKNHTNNNNNNIIMVMVLLIIIDTNNNMVH
jgi:hypothetical protein